MAIYGIIIIVKGVFMDISSILNRMLLEITNIPGSDLDVCRKMLEHYESFITFPEPIVQQIAEAMVGNLTEYYNIANIKSNQFKLAIPHLSEMADFMDSKNTPSMDVQSTARIKSFYSTYEKLLMECLNHLEKHEPIPTHGLAKDIIATRDVLSPRYQFKNDPQGFYKQVYGAILDFMDYIDDLSQEDPRYGFAEVSPKKQAEISRSKKISILEEENLTIPAKNFLDYALELRQVPEIYKYIAGLKGNMTEEQIRDSITYLKSTSTASEVNETPIAKLIKNQIKKESLIDFRNTLEQEFLDSLNKNSAIYKDYVTKSKEDFIFINKLLIKPEFRDYLEVISSIDDALAEGKTTVSFDYDFVGGVYTKGLLCEKLQVAKINQELKYISAMKNLKGINLDFFHSDFTEATKLAHYANCVKDYMRYPKESGYQSLHLTVTTPFGCYEKQFRTEAQHEHAEYGRASHSKSYKPYEKENFHRLKVPTPLMPTRDREGNIITPIKLAPLSFEEAVKEYYHKDFSYFADGLTMDMFKAVHPEDFDQAMLDLSTSSGKMLERVRNAFGFLKKKKSPKSTDDSYPSYR